MLVSAAPAHAARLLYEGSATIETAYGSRPIGQMMQEELGLAPGALVEFRMEIDDAVYTAGENGYRSYFSDKYSLFVDGVEWISEANGKLFGTAFWVMPGEGAGFVFMRRELDLFKTVPQGHTEDLIARFGLGAVDLVEAPLAIDDGAHTMQIIGGYNQYQSTNAQAFGGVTFKVTNLSAVPEPATWGMMIVGFGMAGSMVRSTRRRNAATLA